MSPTTPRRLAVAMASVGAGALVATGVALPATAAETQPDSAESEFQLSTTSAVDPTSDGAERLAEYDEATLESAASSSELSLDSVKELVESDLAVVSQSGRLSYTDEFEAPDEEASEVPAGDVPGDPEGGSRPGAPFTVYLDFDGATLENTEWNRYYGQDVYDLAPDSSASDEEYVQQVWARVAEDYAPFNINVTTADPGEDALVRSGPDDNEYGMTAVITDTTDIEPAQGASGRAWVSGFGDAFHSPALIFAPVARENNAPDVGNVASHEVGHTLGLGHHGIGGDEYYGDTQAEPESLWGPIMGAPWSAPLSQWSNGDYPDATNAEQDDIAEITASEKNTNSVVLRDGDSYWEGQYCSDGEDPNNPQPGDTFYKPNADGTCNPPGDELQGDFYYAGRAAHADDDHGDANDAATDIDNSSGEFEIAGEISTSDDVDVFTLTTAGGPLSVEATPATVGPNLDIEMQLLDSNGEVVAEDNPETSTNLTSPPLDRQADGLTAAIEEDVEGGVYYLTVDGAGQGDPAENTPSNGAGYTDYASLGNYSLTGSAEAFEAAPVEITAPEDGAEVEQSGVEVSGTAEPGAAVTLTAGDDTVGQAEVDDQGNWTSTLESDLPYGNSTITAQQKVGDIDVPATAEVNVVVPVDAPVISKPEDGDTATTATPSFSGEGIPGATVAVQVACGDTTVDGEAQVDDEGAWSFTPEEELPAGECEVTATQTANDVTSSEAGPVSFTVDISGGDENGDENGDESGDAGGTEDGDEDLPDTGAGSSNLLILAGGLALLGMGAALYARTRRGAIES